MAVAELMPVTINSGANVTVRKDGVSASKAALIQLLLTSGVTVAENAPGRDELRAEMQAFALKAGARGRVKLEARRGHDDLAMAACLAVLAAAMQGRR